MQAHIPIIAKFLIEKSLTVFGNVKKKKTDSRIPCTSQPYKVLAFSHSYCVTGIDGNKSVTK